MPVFGSLCNETYLLQSYKILDYLPTKYSYFVDIINILTFEVWDVGIKAEEPFKCR